MFESCLLTCNVQSGVVHEGLRLAFGPITRSARVPMNKDLQYQDYNIPAGVCDFC